MENCRRKRIRVFGIVAIVMGLVGCSTADIKNETVGSVNGDEIKVLELREFMGIRGGLISASQVSVEKKKEALDRLIAGRLLAQDAKSKGLDNTEEYRGAIVQNEQGAWITALFRKEMDSRGKIPDSEIKEEEKKIREAGKNLSEADASMRAVQTLSDKRIRKIEEELVAAARKEIPSSIDQETLEKIGKGKKVSDDAMLALVGTEKISFGHVKEIIRAIPAESHGGQNLASNPTVIRQLLEREITGRALFAYAKKQGIEGSEWLKATRKELERSVLVNLYAEKIVMKDVVVAEKEIADTYAEHAQMFIRDGKKIPLGEVKDQIRGFLLNGKRRKVLDAYVAELTKKAKVTVHEAVLPKV